jgi:beta-syntrophin
MLYKLRSGKLARICNKKNLFIVCLFIRFAALHAAMAVLSTRSMAEHGHRLSKTLSVASVNHWGWLATTAPREGRRNTNDSVSLNSSFGNDSTMTSFSLTTEWQPTFAVLTDRELLLYDSAPWSLDMWTKPNARIPLLMTR